MVSPIDQFIKHHHYRGPFWKEYENNVDELLKLLGINLNTIKEHYKKDPEFRKNIDCVSRYLKMGIHEESEYVAAYVYEIDNHRGEYLIFWIRLIHLFLNPRYKHLAKRVIDQIENSDIFIKRIFGIFINSLFPSRNTYIQIIIDHGSETIYEFLLGIVLHYYLLKKFGIEIELPDIQDIAENARFYCVHIKILFINIKILKILNSLQKISFISKKNF